MTPEELLRARMAQRPHGPGAARDFLRSFIGDADRLQLERGIRHMLTVNPLSIESGIDAIDELLASPQPPGLLAELVALDANRALRDPSDAGARTWLEALVADVRRWLEEDRDDDRR